MTKNAIVYTELDSPMGPMIAGATDRGVSFLEWQDRGGVERILERVTRRYRCSLEPGTNDHLMQLDEELKQYFRRELRQFELTIDVTGTRFEQDSEPGEPARPASADKAVSTRPYSPATASNACSHLADQRPKRYTFARG